MGKVSEEAKARHGHYFGKLEPRKKQNDTDIRDTAEEIAALRAKLRATINVDTASVTALNGNKAAKALQMKIWKLEEELDGYKNLDTAFKLMNDAIIAFKKTHGIKTENEWKLADKSDLRPKCEEIEAKLTGKSITKTPAREEDKAEEPEAKRARYTDEEKAKLRIMFPDLVDLLGNEEGEDEDDADEEEDEESEEEEEHDNTGNAGAGGFAAFR